MLCCHSACDSVFLVCAMRLTGERPWRSITYKRSRNKVRLCAVGGHCNPVFGCWAAYCGCDSLVSTSSQKSLELQFEAPLNLLRLESLWQAAQAAGLHCPGGSHLEAPGQGHSSLRPERSLEIWISRDSSRCSWECRNCNVQPIYCCNTTQDVLKSLKICWSDGRSMFQTQASRMPLLSLILKYVQPGNEKARHFAMQEEPRRGTTPKPEGGCRGGSPGASGGR